jgi:hypothetical protein
MEFLENQGLIAGGSLMGPSSPLYHHHLRGQCSSTSNSATPIIAKPVLQHSLRKSLRIARSGRDCCKSQQIARRMITWEFAHGDQAKRSAHYP